MVCSWRMEAEEKEEEKKEEKHLTSLLHEGDVVM